METAKNVLVVLSLLGMIAAFVLACTYQAAEPTEEVDPDIVGNWSLEGSYQQLDVYRLRVDGATCFVLDGYSDQAGISCIATPD